MELPVDFSEYFKEYGVPLASGFIAGSIAKKEFKTIAYSLLISKAVLTVGVKMKYLKINWEKIKIDFKKHLENRKINSMDRIQLFLLDGLERLGLNKKNASALLLGFLYGIKF